MIGISTPSGQPVASSAAVTYAATTNIDFSKQSLQTISLTGDVTLTTSNTASGKPVVVRFISDGSTRAFTFPGSWTFIGAPAPANIAASKTGILSLTAFGAGDANVLAAYAVQP